MRLSSKRGEALEIVVVLIGIAMIATIITLISIGVATHVNNNENKISQGTVVEKQIEYGECPHYRLKIKGIKNGETVEYWIDVTPEQYSEYHIEDYFIE